MNSKGKRGISDGHKIAALSFTVALALAGVVVLLWLLGGGTPSAHADSPHRVAPNCTGIPPPCHTTIQAAVDAAVPGDEIRVASGNYTGVQGRPAPAGYNGPSVITQVVYISKTVTIRGGYTTTNWTTSYPITQPTTLDAEGRGRVILIAGDISPTIEGLRVTGGDVTGLGGNSGWGAGGGVYVINATVTISNNQVFGNTSGSDSFPYGGGLYLRYSDATLTGNTVTSNTAPSSGPATCGGGGLYLDYSDATFSGNTIISNNTSGCGGGLYLHYSDATLSGDTVISNTAWRGGGLFLAYSAAALSGNAVTTNTADINGGGLYLHYSAAALSGNAVTTNTADINGGGLYFWNSDGATLSGNTIISNIAHDGGGLYLHGSNATLSENTITANTADINGGGLYLDYSAATLNRNTVTANTNMWRGGGLYLWHSDATLSGNTIISNTAISGGGLYLFDSDIRLVNTLVADNEASPGGGLYISGSSPRLLHTTIARNSGSSGVYITNAGSYYSTVWLTNTILVSHTVGIKVSGWGNTATLESTLWYSNTKDWDSTGIIVTGTRNYWDDPRFAADGYHLMSGSAAIDKGVDVGVTTDIDGDSRLQGSAPDLGADEFGSVSAPYGDIYLPIILKNASL